MATRTEANTVYAAGLVQGIVLVTFPAASMIFTDPAAYDLSSTQYGTMFLPQVVTAIIASLLGGDLARRLGSKRVYLVGLLANQVSMALLIVSQLVAGERAGTGAGIPTRFWVFAAFAALYGVCETMNGNWAQLEMTRQLGASAVQASLALTTFWAMVTAGRVLFALVQRWLPTRNTYHLLPFVLAAALVAVALLPQGTPALGVLVFGLAGLGCSALLPLTISFGQEQLVVMSASAAGGVIAFYQLGYGIAAFGAGPLQDAGGGLPTIFGCTAVAAVAMGGLSFVLTARQPAVPATRA